MMEIKELRIGNWVNFIPDNGNFIVSEIGGYYIYNKTINGLHLVDVEPIPITEEWLLKFGFIKECDWKISIGEGAFIWIDENDFTVSIGIPYEASGNQRTMKHVHQLQNLYFALMGKEL